MQQFTDLFIKRPVFSWVLSLLLLAVGFMAIKKMPIREYPKTDSAMIVISTSFPGASAQVVESFVSTPIETHMETVKGVDYVTSSSSQGASEVDLYLKLNANVEQALTQVGQKLSSVRSQLPEGILDPEIHKQNSSNRPVMMLSFRSKRMSLAAIGDYLTRSIVPELSTVPGVAKANVWGPTFAMRIWLNPVEMSAHHVTMSDVSSALKSQNVQMSSGQLKGGNQLLNLNVKGSMNSAADFKNMIIRAGKNGNNVYLRDIAHVEVGSETYDFSANFDGHQGIAVGIKADSDANPITVSDNVRKMLPRLEANLPKGMHVAIGYDFTKFIKASLREVFESLIISALCVILVIFFFLGSIRATLIPVVTIPISIVGVCAVMYALHFSINTLTLLAWVLAIGLVVDDAIVVLENIHRHVHSGMKPFDAAIKGAREIRFAIIAMTLTLAAVYAPIGFMGGLTGELFSEFAFSLAGAVVVSGFISLTLTPMMCARILSAKQTESWFSLAVDKLFGKLQHAYKQTLQHILSCYKSLVVLVTALVLASIVFLIQTIPSALAPKEDQGVMMTILSGPPAANLNYMDSYIQRVQDLYRGIPERTHSAMIGGMDGLNSAFGFLVLKPWSERSRSAETIRNDLQQKLDKFPGVRAFTILPSSLPGHSGNFPVGFLVKTTGSYEALENVMQRLLAACRKNPGIMNPDINLKYDQPELSITIDRAKAANLGISIADINSSLGNMLSNGYITRYDQNGQSYVVIPQLPEKFSTNPKQLANIQVRTGAGKLVPLSDLISYEVSTVPESLQHFNGLRSASLSAGLKPGYTVGEALKFLRAEAKEIFPPGFSYDYIGGSRQFVENSGEMTWLFILALIIIFLVLAAQFESWRDPLVVMMTVPLSIAGGMLAIRLGGGSFNIYTEIGLVTLIGLISKHGILIVEFANQLREKKQLDLVTAVVEAAATRLRPILMTTAAMVLGTVPLVFAMGAGAEARHQIGLVIVGGLLIGSCLSLFVVPTFYIVLEVVLQKLKDWFFVKSD